MTKEEIRALIEAKIAGQGSAVDVGSALPVILEGILGLIEQGGGGGTSDAVQYVPQALTEAQQMQARLNQGLYAQRSKTGGEIVWDGDTTGLETIDLGDLVAYKVADSPKDIPVDAFVGYTMSGSPQEGAHTRGASPTPFNQVVDLGETMFPGASGRFIMASTSGRDVVVVADHFEASAQGLSISADGIYFSSSIRSFVYDDYVVIENKISPNFIEQDENSIIKVVDYTHNRTFIGNCQIRIEEETEIQILPGTSYNDTSISYVMFGDQGCVSIGTKAGNDHLFVAPLSEGMALCLAHSSNPLLGGIWINFVSMPGNE